MTLHEDLDFEISFFEEVLEERPDYLEALIALGDAYTKKGRYHEGLAIDKRLIYLKPDDPVIRYNLACSYSLLQMPDQCLEALEKAIRLGYRDFLFMEEDPDLAFIQKDPRYQELLSRHSRIE
jgi:tetratricopeptide (TPR) repeat protein